MDILKLHIVTLKDRDDVDKNTRYFAANLGHQIKKVEAGLLSFADLGKWIEIQSLTENISILTDAQRLKALSSELKEILGTWDIRIPGLVKDIENCIEFANKKQIWETYEQHAKDGDL